MKSNFLKIAVIILLITAPFFTFTLFSQDNDICNEGDSPTACGRKIMDKIDALPTPAQLITTSQMFIIRSKEDEERYKSTDSSKRIPDKAFITYTKDYPATGESKTLIEYIYPTKTMKILRWSYENADDDVWVKVADGNVTRIAAGEKSSKSFMGSHITYEDVEGRDLDDYEFTYLGISEQKVDGKGYDCYKIKATRVTDDANSAYSKAEFYVRKNDLTVVRADMYDKKEKPYKTMRVLKTKKIKGNNEYTIQTEVGMSMVGEKYQYTVIEMGDIKVDKDAEIDESKFRKESL